MSRPRDIVGQVIGRVRASVPRPGYVTVERAHGRIHLIVRSYLGTRFVMLSYQQAVELSDILRAAATFPQVGASLRVVHEKVEDEPPDP